MNDKNFQDILSYLYEGVYVVDRTRKIIFWNKGSEQITGYSSEEVVNKQCYNNILQHVTADGKQLCFGGCPLHHTLQTGDIQEANVFLMHKEGYRVPVTVKSLPVLDDEGNIVAAIEVFTDESFRKENIKENRKLKELLTTDPLTQVKNRRYLDFHIENMIKEYDEFQNIFGVLFFDIDHFKNVNDTYGHSVGDEILKIVSKSIGSSLRRGDVIGRWGGEEFIAVLRINNAAALERIAETLRVVVSKSIYSLNEKEHVSVTISIGGTLYIPGEKAGDTIARADQNMYISKTSGRNKVTIK
ncbi:MAG: sensor domain-containing diguanylate cyclase [Firmicutes bacterium]|nr:sensor domain-containing diguanylate cyclase [Bacillota bacterium]